MPAVPSTSDTVTITLAATGAGNALIVVASLYDHGYCEALSSVTLGGSGAGFSSQLYVTGTDVDDRQIWANFSIAGGADVPGGDRPSANGSCAGGGCV